MEEKQASWSITILYLLAWLICSLLAITDVLMVRGAVVTSLSAVYARQVEASSSGEQGAAKIEATNRIQAIDQWFLFGGGIVAVSLAIAIEYYFRIGQKMGNLLKRIGIVLGIEVGMIVVCILIQALV